MALGCREPGSKLAFKIAHRAADTHILHDTNSLLSLANELVLSLLNLKLGILRGLGLLMVLLIRLARELEHATLSPRLRRIKQQSRVLDAPARPRREHQVGVKGSVPPRQEASLDLCILREPGLANLLAGKGILLERGRERVLAGAGVLLLEELAAGQGGAGNGVGEGLGLGLGDGGCGEGGLGFGGGGGGGEELDLLADAAAEIRDVFADVGVVVALVGVLCSAPWSVAVKWRCSIHSYIRDLQHLLVNLLQCIHPLLQLNVVRRKLGLISVSRCAWNSLSFHIRQRN